MDRHPQTGSAAIENHRSDELIRLLRVTRNAPARPIAIKEVEDEIFTGAQRTLPRPGARPVLLSVSAAAPTGSIRGAGAGSLCRAGAAAATDRVSALRSGLALGARASQPVWTMDPRALRAKPIPL